MRRRRLPALPHQKAEDFVAHRRGRRRRILRIKRHDQNAVAAARDQRFEPRGDRRIGIAHRPVDDDMLAERLENAGEFFRLRAGDGLERQLVLLVVPDFLVVARFAPRTHRQNDAVEQELPEQRIPFDDARVGEEFLQIASHRLGLGGIGRAEIDEQHADTRRGGHRLVGRADKSVCRSAALRSECRGAGGAGTTGASSAIAGVSGRGVAGEGMGESHDFVARSAGRRFQLVHELSILDCERHLHARKRHARFLLDYKRNAYRSCDLTWRLTIESQCGPIPLNVGPAALSRAAFHEGNDHGPDSLSCSSFSLPVPAPPWRKRILLLRNEPAAATRIGFAKRSWPTSSKWRPACRAIASASAALAGRCLKATKQKVRLVIKSRLTGSVIPRP